ncbi:hypothetical protein [Nocardioides zeae]
MQRTRRTAAAAAITLAVVLAGCTAEPVEDEVEGAAADTTTEPGTPAQGGVAADDPRLEQMAEHAMDAPGALTDPLLGADMLVSSTDELDDDTIAAIRDLPGVEAAEPIGLAQIPVQDQVLTVAAVDPATYRRFTPAESAQLLDVWTRVANGEIAVPTDVGRRCATRTATCGSATRRARPTSTSVPSPRRSPACRASSTRAGARPSASRATTPCSSPRARRPRRRCARRCRSSPATAPRCRCSALTSTSRCSRPPC